MAAQTAAVWPTAEISAPGIQSLRPSAIAAASVPLAIATARGAPPMRMGSVSARWTGAKKSGASTAPAGLGVFELFFIKAMPDVPRLKVLSALLVFRLFYLVLPLLIAIAVVIIFERSKLRKGDGRSDPS